MNETDKLRNLCKEYLDGRVNGTIGEDSDYSEYISEAALELFCGPDVFKILNGLDEV